MSVFFPECRRYTQKPKYPPFLVKITRIVIIWICILISALVIEVWDKSLGGVTMSNSPEILLFAYFILPLLTFYYFFVKKDPPNYRLSPDQFQQGIIIVSDKYYCYRHRRKYWFLWCWWYQCSRYNNWWHTSSATYHIIYNYRGRIIHQRYRYFRWWQYRNYYCLW